ncbi:unnamed protein product [Prunus brigantina]
MGIPMRSNPKIIFRVRNSTNITVTEFPCLKFFKGCSHASLRNFKQVFCLNQWTPDHHIGHLALGIKHFQQNFMSLQPGIVNAPDDPEGSLQMEWPLKRKK